MALSAMATMKPVRATDISPTPGSEFVGKRSAHGHPASRDDDGSMSPTIAGVIKGAHAISVPDPSGKINRMSDDLTFAAEFPAATCQQWVRLASRVLKGRPIDSLTARTADGLAIEPLYARARDGARIAARAGRWQVMARVDHPDPATANAQALEDLEGGANGLVLVGAGAVGAHGHGLLPAANTLARVLDGVLLDAGIAIEFDLNPQTKDLPLALAALIKERGIAPASVDIRFGFDPLGASVHHGGFPLPWAQFAPLTARL